MVPRAQGLLDFKTMATQWHLHRLCSSALRLQMEVNHGDIDQEGPPEGKMILLSARRRDNRPMRESRRTRPARQSKRQKVSQGL